MSKLKALFSHEGTITLDGCTFRRISHMYELSNGSIFVDTIYRKRVKVEDLPELLSKFAIKKYNFSVETEKGGQISETHSLDNYITNKFYNECDSGILQKTRFAEVTFFLPQANKEKRNA